MEYIRKYGKKARDAKNFAQDNLPEKILAAFLRDLKRNVFWKMSITTNFFVKTDGNSKELYI